jgi:hypothetical protein
MIAEIVGIDYIMPYIFGMFLVFSVGYLFSIFRGSIWINVIGFVVMLICGFAILDAVLFLVYDITHPSLQGEIVKIYINGTAKLDNGTIVNLTIPFLEK